MKFESSLFLVEAVLKVDRYQVGLPQNVTILSLMMEMVMEMMTDKLVAAVFGMTKTLKIE